MVLTNFPKLKIAGEFYWRKYKFCIQHKWMEIYEKLRCTLTQQESARDHWKPRLYNLFDVLWSALDTSWTLDLFLEFMRLHETWLFPTGCIIKRFTDKVCYECAIDTTRIQHRQHSAIHTCQQWYSIMRSYCDFRHTCSRGWAPNEKKGVWKCKFGQQCTNYPWH